MNKTFSQIGKPIIRQDGLEKVTGQAKFADDYYFPGQLYGIMVRMPATHAKINSIDYSAIQNNPALYAICQSQDIPGAKKIGLIRKDQPIFSSERVVTSGDAVAMLVGESEDALRSLPNEIKFDYTSLPLLTDPRKSLESDAPLVHPDLNTNLIVHYPLRKGDVEKGLAESEFVLQQEYSTPFIEHGYIEPEAVIALPLEGKKGIKIIGSIQNPHTTRKVVALVLGWPLARVRIVQAEIGGSFGGKDDTMCILAARAAIAAIKTQRPIKIRFTREDSILESYKRHPYYMKYKVGFNSNGKIKAMKIDLIADGGAYASMSPFVTWRSVVQATGPYEVEHVHTDVRAVYTNNPYTGAMRGFGSPQPIFAQESIMDEIAEQLNMSPVEIRRINGFRSGSITASGQKLEKHDVNLLTVLNTAVKETAFNKKWNKYRKQLQKANLSAKTVDSPYSTKLPYTNLKLKGIGLATSFRGCSLGAEGVDAAAAYLSVQPDGSAYLICGLAENGQGLRTTFSIIAAEVLGVTVEDIVYLEQDTGIVPDSGPTVASRSTLMGGGAVKNAAEIIRKRFETLLKKHWNIEKCEFIFKDKQVVATNIINSDKSPSSDATHQYTISFPELCTLAYGSGISMATIGWYAGPKVHWDEEVGQGPAYFTYVYGCQVVEVTVDTVTGEVYIDRITAVHDAGKVINLLGAQGQIYGGVTQGAGYGLWEEITTHDGQIQELNFDRYIMPTSKDIGEITPIFIEGKEKFGAWGAKSLGEPTLELTAAAIANAVRNAVGIRYYDLPLNLEEVLLQKKLKPTKNVK